MQYLWVTFAERIGSQTPTPDLNCMDHTVELLHTTFETHDVKRFVTTRPDGLDWAPGQGVELALDREGWRDEGRPFTPTGRVDEPVLEFTIKAYPSHDGVTTRLHDLKPGARLHMSDPFGSITWQGPGVFVAGGAGVTPFLAILREQGDRGALGASRLHFSNSTPHDVICEKELRHLLGDGLHLTCTRQSAPGYDERRIDQEYLRAEVDDLDQPFYVCGPPDFVEALQTALADLGVSDDHIVVEGG
jgi:cytochrome-b5 reductase